ncbi:MAG: hypothetical protein Rubg2KO_01720 [Rubricoccaceae bacterium]
MGIPFELNLIPPMHPDQRTPDSHRYQASDSQSTEDAPSSTPPDADQPTLDTDDSAADELADGARIAEAGNAYVGRQLDDALKSHPRVEDGESAVDEDPTTARTE